MSRDSLDALRAVLGNSKVRGAMTALLMLALSAAAATAGKIASWAFSEPWKSQPETIQAAIDAKSANAKSTSNDTNLQHAEKALWGTLVAHAYEMRCEDQSPTGRAACVLTARDQYKYAWDHSAATTDASRSQVAAEEVFKMLQPAPAKVR